MSATTTERERAMTLNPNDECHVACNYCEPFNRPGVVALCGARLKGVEYDYSEPVTCAVCADLDAAPCPRCGR